MSRAYLESPARFVWHYVLARRGAFLGLLLVVVTAAVCAVIMQYQMKCLVDAMASPRRSVQAVWVALALFLWLMATESVLLRFSAWLACRATIGAGVQIRADLFDVLAGQSFRYFADNLAGSLGQRVTGNAGAFGALVNTTAWRIVPPIVDYIGALVIFTLINGAMAGALGVYVALTTAMLIASGRRGQVLHTAYFAQGSAVAGDLVDVIANMWAVKAFSARRREGRRLREQFEVEAEAQQTSWMYTEKTRLAYDLAVWLMAVMMWVWAVGAWRRHALTPGDVVVITTLTFRILHGSRDVALALVDVSLHVGFIDETLKAIAGIPGPLDAPAALDRPAERGMIEFKDVTFGYEPGHAVLRHINQQITPGEKVGIVGASGSGKTTVIQLIQRLHDPQSGTITIGGTPIGAYTQDSLRSVLAVVPQEIALFHRSILENIRFGRPEASDEEVYAAARAAQCEEFVLRLPQGYATLVGDRGMKLSGGQRQRVGIARAFLKQAPILILDEATSALDTASELQIQRSIIHEFQDRTVIAVAHRLSSLTGYDRILVIDRGRIVEQGRPTELRHRGKVFRAMWRLQAHGAMAEERLAARP